MEPNFQVKQVIIVNKIKYNFLIPFINQALFKTQNPARGDVVIYRKPNTDIPLLGRIIGVPFDQISFNSEGWPIINDSELNIKYIKTTTIENRELKVFQFQISKDVSFNVLKMDIPGFNLNTKQTKVLKEDEYFIMADNIDFSIDSRMHGPVEHKNILGKIINVQF